MKPREFLNAVEDQAIVAAIQQAERKTAGEIRVFVSHRKQSDALLAARKEFVRLGIDKTKERNGVLIYVAPKSQTFAIVGDDAIHAHCGEEFWRQVADEMSTHFKAGRFTAGIVQGVTRAGEILASHFPRQTDDRNELPDAIEHD